MQLAGDNMEVNVASEKEFILFKLPDAEIQNLESEFPGNRTFLQKL